MKLLHVSKYKKILSLLSLVGLFGFLTWLYHDLRRKIPDAEIAREIDGEHQQPDQLKLLFTGDTGTGNSNQKTVALAMERVCVAEQVDGVVLLGDNFYFEGVSSVDDPQWQSKFEKMYNTPCLAARKFYAVLGNHDIRSNPNAQILFTKKSNFKWNLPNRYYALHFNGIADFFAIDSNFPDACGMPEVCSLDWILSKMNVSNAPWKIVLGHHPMLSAGKYPKPNWYAGRTIPKLLCDGKADFYFAGHDHNLQHLRGRVFDSGCEVNQLVIGGGGGDLSPVKAVEGKSLFALKNHGFVSAKIEKTKIKLSYFVPGQDLPVYEISQDKGMGL